MNKTRYALVGVGDRSWMYLDALLTQFAEFGELAAICDRNEGRLRLRQTTLNEQGGNVAAYRDDQFDRMLAEIRPDAVIVTTQDSAHDDYICRAMQAGCDVITEKPMTMDAQKCQRIIDTQKATGRSCRVTFNYRYAPPRTQIKELLMSGVIGNVVSVDFHWLLDTKHGADYFRRWHRYKKNSGGLLVHKATHHFDLVNWWLSSVPETVYATGTRNFYSPQMAERYGITNRSERCLTCAETERCPFALDLRAYPKLKTTYLDQETYDGYFRDRCLFDASIDIEDTMQAIVTYRSGAAMTYSLHAFMPWEGYIVSFNGTRGRLEHICQETVYFSGDGSVPGELMPEGTKTKIYPLFQAGYDVEIWQATGGHGGGDPILLADIFDPNAPQDKYLRAADYRAGSWSILTGIAANQSVASGQPVRISDIISGLDEPAYPPMPSAADPIPLPKIENSMPEWFKKASS
ncbi:oxidoreductase domain protein [Candidatus Moduliflexus flocculans]|uniref:Oxidoreductase domain protein n=1 Tax=Candidatus Moduliflexus flocculans TaxID=1499966 RepID=A0A0S6W1E1_9BACT|nr:oxidoreductase domain protein [Candidatus Moduliflexus flocculans]